MKINITWEVSDGYVGKSRPQHCTFNSDDYMDEEDWNDLTEEEKQKYIDDFVQEEFYRNISWAITNIKET